MAKLYPPYLDGTVPSFYADGEKITISIPFALNRTVGKADIAGFALKIKTIQSNTLLGTFTKVIGLNDDSLKDILVKQEIEFDISNLNLVIGQFYKVQLAFIDRTETVGYYSSTAVAKYTTKPLVTISGLNANKTNNHAYRYLGNYSQQYGDATEKMYSSRLVLKDNLNVVYDSGDVIHRVRDDDSSREAHEEFVIPNELEENKSYYMTYTVTTNNGLVVSSSRYRIIKAGTVSPDMDVTLTANLNYEEGYVDLILKNNAISNTKAEKKVTGMFYIVRSASNDSNSWREIGSFTLQAQVPSTNLWRDYSIEQGVKYTYAIQQYNNYGLRSDRVESNTVIADFEDAFLYDGVRQLKIKYNPKMTSFKRDVVEQKTDTIGSKYPFIFRNGNIDYHEFPISGLISYLSDENRQFIPLEELGGIEVPTTQLVSENITAERMYKMKVLEWLTNGEPKLFKSPTEGNFVVRLLNVSLSPNDTVGRMLHTFSATAYEVASNTYETLRYLGFVKIESDVVQTRYQSINIAGHSPEMDNIANSIMNYFELKVNVQLTEELYYRIMNATAADGTPIDISKNTTELYTLVLNPDAEMVNVTAAPGTTAIAIAALANKITYASGKLNSRTAYSVDIRDAAPGTIFYLDDAQITIGSSGCYYVDLPDGIQNIILPQEQPNLYNPILDIYEKPRGVVTYGYHSDMANVFDLYCSSEIVDYPVRVWYGPPSRVVYNPYKGLNETHTDIIKCIEDVKTSIAKIFKVKFSKRYVQQIFAKEVEFDVENEDGEKETETRTTYFYDMDCKNEIMEAMMNPAYIYQVCKPRTDYKYEDYYLYTQWFTDANFRRGYYVSEGEDHPFATNEMIDGLTKEHFLYTPDFYTFSVGSGDVILEEMDICLEEPDLKIETIKIGKGVVCEMSYQTKVMTYSCEIEEFQVPKAKRDMYDTCCRMWEETKRKIGELSDEDVATHSPTYQALMRDYELYRNGIDLYYEDLIKYVSVAKKDVEEETKS